MEPERELFELYKASSIVGTGKSIDFYIFA